MPRSHRNAKEDAAYENDRRVRASFIRATGTTSHGRKSDRGTEREGARLEGIEARFGASPATNRRLLQQTLTIVQNSADQGIKAAVAAKDFRSAAVIQEAMDLDLTPAPVGLTDEQEARRQELLRKQAEGTLDATN